MSSIQRKNKPIIKVARSFQQGKDIFGRNKKISKNLPGRAPNAPAPRKISPHGQYVQIKRFFKKFYNISTKTFNKCVDKAIKKYINNKKSGTAEDNLISILELRLASLVFRSGWASTTLAASQLINHGHIKVNNQIVDIQSYQCKVNDVIELDRDYYTGNTHVKDSVDLHSMKNDKPDWIAVSENKIVVNKAPKLATVFYPLEFKIDQIIRNHRR